MEKGVMVIRRDRGGTLVSRDWGEVYYIKDAVLGEKSKRMEGPARTGGQSLQ